MPNIESGSINFYEKNGFIQTNYTNNTIKIETISSQTNDIIRIDKVPYYVIETIPFVIGLYQHSSAHIWNVYNARDENDIRTVSSFKIDDTYINIGAFEPTDTASVACWSNMISPETISKILYIGNRLGYKYLNFCVLDYNVIHFKSYSFEMSEEHDIFIERYL